MNDLTHWLKRFGLDQYAAVFAENAVDLETVVELVDDDLKELNIPLGHRKKLLKAIGELRTQGAPNTAQSSAAESSEAERRQLTVMFCDLVGSTALAQQLDPEDLNNVTRAFQDSCKAAIERFEGYVARYMGDGILVYFGYPRAHEDDAERAVRAALDVVQAMPQLNSRIGPRLRTWQKPALESAESELKVRIGIATGSVVVGDLIGEGASQESAATGETPNLAARLQSAADPDSIVISDSTHELTVGRFQYEAIDDLQLKGISEPVRAWYVLGESKIGSRFEAAATRGLTPLVGRDEEIGLFMKRWEQAKEGDGQVVLLSGEAGVGKSRILERFQKQIKGENPNRILFYCSPYHQNTALYPQIDQLGRALRFDQNDDSTAKLNKLTNTLAKLNLPPREYVPILASLLSIPTGEDYPPLALPPDEAKIKTLEVLMAIIEAMAMQTPVVMVVEDVHWIDSSTRELVNLIIDRVPRLPMLLVVTFRLEFESPWGSRGQVTVLTLNRLSRRETVAMVKEITNGKDLPQELLDQIVAKTDGVPLFVEELTKTILESGLLKDCGTHYELNGPIPPLAIPASLQDSLMARLDRLAPVKEVAQLAATIGRNFSRELLLAVSDLSESDLEAALSQLEKAELIYRYGLTPNVTCQFKHALVQDAAYGSLLRSKRHQYHSRIAQVLEQQFPDKAQTEPALLAHHYTAANLPKQAIGYWLKSAELLHHQGSTDMSMDAYRRVLDIAEDAEDRCEALIGLAGNMRLTDEYESALEALNEAQALASEKQHIAKLTRIHHLRGNLYFPLGNTEGCLQEHEHALQFSQQSGDTENEARALAGLGDAHYSKGRMRTAHEHFQRSIELSKQHQHYHIVAGNQYMLAWTRLYLNEVRQSLSEALDAIESAAAHNYLRAEMVARLAAGRTLIELADYQSAAEHIERGLTIAEKLGANRFKPFLITQSARIKLAQNEKRSEIVKLLEEAADISQQTSIGFVGPWVLATLAFVEPELEQSQNALQRGEEILSGNCVGHNYFAFYRMAMETCLRWQQWDEVYRYSTALEEFCRPEPLPRSEFFIERARILAQNSANGQDETITAHLVTLRNQAEEIGLLSAIPALNEALND